MKNDLQNFQVGNYKLDEFQMQLLYSTHNAIVIAGAGAGKTLTIIGKINYLIKYQNILPNQILVISFTNASVNDIKQKLNEEIDVFTFHKLAMKILELNNINYKLCSSSLLSYIIQEYLNTCEINIQKIILKFLNLNMSYHNFIKSKYFNSFCNLILTFINLWKTNNLKFEDIPLKKYKSIEKKILLLAFNIYNIYIKEKNSNRLYDFDDLIIKASSIHTKCDYKYIIIDEFQDTSQIRLDLIKELSTYNNSKVIVVGDDWQSIYKFSGCNLNIFLNFPQFFSNVNIIKLVNTYRNSQELINIASKFVLKNTKQISKILISSKHTKTPLLFMPINDKISSLKKVLTYYSSLSDDIMILSRNNKDILEYIDNTFKYDNNVIYYNNKSFKYYTVHKSKGLESEYVILLNCNNDYLGFPNKIENNPLIDKLYKENEIKYAEERRLFYVAITRCKVQTILLYSKNNPSIFIKEIRRIVKKELGKIVYFK